MSDCATSDGKPPGAWAPSWLLCITPWLQLFGALLAFVLISLFTAIQSELGKHVSTGESPAFAWARTYMTELLWFGLAYLLVTSALQHLGTRLAYQHSPPCLKALMGVEMVAVGILAMAFVNRWDGVLPWGHALLQLCILLQVFVALWRSSAAESNASIRILDLSERSHFLFLSFLFLLAAVPAYLDPSWQRMQGHVQLDSRFEIVLSRVLSAVFSGVTGLWFGMGTLVILAGFRVFWMRLDGRSPLRGGVSFLPFLSISGLCAAVGLGSLWYAIDWELSGLHLMGAMLPLFILLCGGGGALSYVAFRRLAVHASRAREKSLIGIVALCLGAVLVFPITWLLTRPGYGRWSWRFILGASLLGSLLLGYYVLYGDLFNPWFTVFSYLKGVVLKATAVVAAGILVLIFEELFSIGSRLPSKARRRWGVVAVIFLLGFLPFAALERYRETKAAILQFNELSMVDATYARVLSEFLRMGRWIRLGQVPKVNDHQEPWPLPWTLEKTGPSLLPKDFNLIVIVVDALRGDAFHSAGYQRDLTPFLDQWAQEEAVSFRRAYSQGGGTFAALPFFVAGRSRFALYGPDLSQENLYFKLARAEGIHKVMVVKEFGPRAIFPRDFPVIELDGSHAGADRRSVPADTVFGWAQDAIGNLANGERFLAFLTLMDVHNDLWKKEDGLDFGDSPRDLYDNNLSYVDRAFKRFVAWLKRKDIYHRTVIVFTSDHGEQFWEHGASLHGHTLYEEEIRIPLILLAHGIRGRVDDVPAVAADIAPTLAELAGYSVHPPYNDPHMGISLLPLLLGKERDRYLKRDIVGRASFKRRYFLYRNWEWKLVYSPEFDLLQLFNIAKDPRERTNLLQENPDLAVELERELLGYLERVERKSYRPLLAFDGRS